MNKVIRILSITIAGLIAVAAVASPVSLVFSVEPAETLPLVPVTFRVRAINTGSAPATIPIRVRLEARSGAGDWEALLFATSEHEGGAMVFPVDLDGPPWIELAPGETRVLDYLPGPSSPPWVNHKELLKPGTYRLRLVTWSQDQPTEPIISNEALLTIRPPTGEDAGAWALIRGLTNPATDRRVVADQLWRLYPNSVYTAMTPRLAPIDGNWGSYIASIEEALAKNPPPGFADTYKAGIAYSHLQLMDHAMHELNVQKAFEHSEAARALLQELLAKETEADLKLRASELKENVGTLAQIGEVVERLRLHKPAPACERTEVKLVRSSFVDLMSGEATDKAKKTLAGVIADLDKYEAETAKTPPDMHAALAALEQAASRIETAIKSEWISSTDGTTALKAIAGAAELSATKAIDASTLDAGAKKSDLDLARRKFEDGRAAVEAGDYKKAISRFREALHKAQGASSARDSFC